MSTITNTKTASIDLTNEKPSIANPTFQLTKEGDLYLASHSGPIGEMLTDKRDINIITADLDSYVAGPSILLTPGVWILSGRVAFRSGGTSGTRGLCARLYFGNQEQALTTPLTLTRFHMSNSWWAVIPVQDIQIVTKNTWCTLAASSTMLPSTNTSDRSGTLKAVRIK